MQVVAYADADFGNDKITHRSTTGGLSCFIGKNSYFAISACSKKQTAVSHSTPEAEVVAADHVVRTEGLPLLDVVEALTGKPKTLLFEEDNETCVVVIKTGRSPALRHVGRTHGIDIGWLHERYAEKQITVNECHTDNMRADIFTKAFESDVKWERALKLIGHWYPDTPANLALTEKIDKRQKKLASSNIESARHLEVTRANTGQ